MKKTGDTEEGCGVCQQNIGKFVMKKKTQNHRTSKIKYSKL